jgi:hypothetical protein
MEHTDECLAGRPYDCARKLGRAIAAGKGKAPYPNPAVAIRRVSTYLLTVIPLYIKEQKMSYECQPAKKSQTCIRCGRAFNAKELVFVDADGDTQCIEACWRLHPAKVIPFRRPEPAKTKPAKPAATRTPFVEKESVHGGLISDFLKKEIEDMARDLKKGA